MSFAPGWALEHTRAERLWARGLRGQGVSVGHLDTGVNVELPALAGRIAAFQRFDLRGEAVPSHHAIDSATHGTRTASLICAGEQGGWSIGVAPEASLISGMVLEGGDVLARVLGGIEWLASQPVRVVSLSLGAPEAGPLFAIALRALRRRDVILVAAAGNDGAGVIHAPASELDVLAVGACDNFGRVASFSGSRVSLRTCERPDLVAPGVGVQTLNPGGELVRADGTSMASALVAGIAALLVQACPNATAAQIRAALIQTARPLHADQHHRARAGRIDPEAALDRLLGGDLPEKTLPPPTPCRRFFDALLNQQLSEAHEEALVDALCAFDTDADDDPEPWTTSVSELLLQVATASGVSPNAVRLLPRCGVAVVQAQQRYLQHLAREPRCLGLSATTLRTNRLW